LLKTARATRGQSSGGAGCARGDACRDPTTSADGGRVAGRLDAVLKRTRTAAPADRSERSSRWNIIVVPAVAAALLLLAFDQGAYETTSWAAAGVVVWWLAVVGVAIAQWPLQRVGPAALPVTLLAAFAGFAAVSIMWAPSVERAVIEFNRTSLYAGVALLVATGVATSARPRVANGILIGVVGVAATALATRFFPQVIDTRQSFVALPVGAVRLNYPIGYWNGLAILVALGVPFLLRATLYARALWLRAAALAAAPALSVVIFLTSSRTGVIAAAVGALAFVLLERRRVAAVTALAVAAGGAVVALNQVAGREAVVDGVGATGGDGRAAAIIVMLACAGVATAYALAVAGAGRFLRPPTPLHERLTAAAVSVAVAAVVAVSDPVARFEAFRSVADVGESGNFVRSHLLSSGGNGRWQLWTGAIEQFRANPIAGGGAGSFQSWWDQHRDYPLFVRDAHSLYAETLAELGLVGAALLCGALGTAVVLALRRRQRETAADAGVTAASAAALVAFLLAAGVDWMWELPAVTVVGMAALGVAVGARPSARSARSTARPVRLLVALAGAVLALLQLPLLLGERAREASRTAARDGDVARAHEQAELARDVAPWAASSYLQLALLAEARRDYAAARAYLNEAIARDPRAWTLWLVSARIETKAGRVVAARASLARARELNPIGVRGLQR
jgi:hypothetical protein